MKTYTMQEFEENFEELLSIVEGGETLRFVTEDGHEFLFTPHIEPTD